MTSEQLSIFDVLHAKKSREKCPTPSFLIHKSTGKVHAVPCNRWKCPVCCERLKWRLRKRLNIALKDKTVRHLTLTIPDDTIDICEKFNNLRTQLRKRGKLQNYFWCKEFQDRGVRHLHVLIFEYIHFGEIQPYWSDENHQYHMKIRLMRNDHAKDYLTKYIGDVEHQNLFCKGERRYSSSRNFFERLPKRANEGDEWTYVTHYEAQEWGVTEDTQFAGTAWLRRIDYHPEWNTKLSIYTPG